MGQERKKNFSVSMLPKEIKSADTWAVFLSEKFGYKISRNEIIRKATLKYMKALEDEYKTMGKVGT